jgi:hypothetical protein
MLLDILYRLHVVAPLLIVSHLLTEVTDAGFEAVSHELLQLDLRWLVQDDGVVVHDLVVLLHAGRGVRPHVVE